MGKMERAKRIMQDRGVLKGMEEVWRLPRELKPEVAESFGDLLLKMGKPDYAIAVYNIAGSPQRLIQVGDALLEYFKKTNRNYEKVVKFNKSRSGFIDESFFHATLKALDSTECAIKCLAAYSLAKNLDDQRKEKVEALKKEYATYADGVKKYLAACESVKSGNFEALDTLRKVISL